MGLFTQLNSDRKIKSAESEIKHCSNMKEMYKGTCLEGKYEAKTEVAKAQLMAAQLFAESFVRRVDR